MNKQTLKCFSKSPFLTIESQSSLIQFIDSSFTSLLIGIFGFNCPIIRWLHRGQVDVLLIQSSQNKLWQHGVSTGLLKISKQMGHVHLSSEMLEAAK